MKPWTDATFAYHVDTDDRIVSLSDNWYDFAQANGAPELTEHYVLGRSLWSFVDGVETRALYQLVLAAVRDQGRRVAFPFRCDAPAHERDLTMTISHRPDEILVFETRVVAERPRRSYGAFFQLGEGRWLVRICSWCKKVRVDEDRWLPMAEATEFVEFFGSRGTPGIAHGVCPRCGTDVLDAAGLPLGEDRPCA